MKQPLQIATRNYELTGPMEEAIRERAAKLDTFCDGIIRCRVLVERPHKGGQKGSACSVKIEIGTPGADITVAKESHDLAVAVKEAFSAARRRLEDHVRGQRGQVKVHEGQPLARVCALFPAQGHGFLATEDGREIYFHENCLVGLSFQDLEVGQAVRYVEATGDEGPQASTVRKA